MENQEIFQPEFENVYSQVTEIDETTGETKKPCKTCNKKSLSSSNFKILLAGMSILFLSFYGLLSLVKDIFSLFTR